MYQARLVTVAASAICLAFATGQAAAQSMKTLAGAYAGVSFDQTDAAGKKTEIFGSNPRAMLILTADGRYSIVVARATLPKFASNSRVKGTSEENAAVVSGSLAHFGKYSLDEKDKTITFHVETATYPNWDGIPQKRPFTLKGGVLNYKVATVSGGTGSASVTWKRLK